MEKDIHHGNGFQKGREPYLNAHLQKPISLNVGETYNVGRIAIIPIHQSPEALRTIPLAVQSLRAQWETTGTKLVVADNGLTIESRRDLNNQLSSMGGIDYTIIDATPKTDLDKSAAFARNKAIQYIQTMAEQHESHRVNGLLFVDSDTVLAPWTIQKLEETMHTSRGVVAVTARSIPVNHIGEETLQQLLTTHEIPEGKVRILPPLFNGSSVDIGKLIGWSGDVATKTCGLYLDHSTVTKMLRNHPDLLLRMPHGSAEDMILSLGLSRYGNIYHNSAAHVLDQARETVEGVRKQRANWGTDHVSLYSDMIKLGFVKPGIKVLEPHGDKWYEWTIPNTENYFGLVINPIQMQRIRWQLQEMIEAEGHEEIINSIGISISEDELHYSITVFDQLNQIIKATSDSVKKTQRSDLPDVIYPDESILRWSPHSRVGQFLGNIRGMHDIQETSGSEFPKVVLFGVRQAGNWE